MHWIDPESLPLTRGKVKHFLINPRGEIDGMILSGKRVVHVPPHMSRMIGKNIAVEDLIRVRAVRPRGAPVLAAVSVTGPNGRELIDMGPDHEGPRATALPSPKATEVEGIVTHALHGPKGELRGAFLDTGVSLRMPPHAAEELSEYLAVGAHVQAAGHRIKNKYGVTVDVEEISFLA
jgi:hypothetical protein